MNLSHVRFTPNKREIYLEKLVSIIMPAYNCEAYIEESIRSVQQQTYENWELIITDDLSSDGTVDLVEAFAKNDVRIKLIKSKVNLGPSGARNIAIEAAQGEYIAFLDSDDIWYPEKLQKQISFMEDNDYLFSYTSYEKINSSSEPIGVVISAPKKVDYKKMLYYGDPIGNLTVAFNSEKLGKFFVPDIKKRNDFALWLRVMSKCDYAYGIDEVLAKYRVHGGSVSSVKKRELIKYHWYLYRHIENLSVVKSCTAIMTLVIVKYLRLTSERLQRLRYIKVKNGKIQSKRSKADA